MKNRILKGIFKILGIAAFVFIFFKLLSSWDKIRTQVSINSAFLFVSSIILLILFYYGLCIGWSSIILKSDEKSNFSELVYVFSKSQLARYLPGGIWNYMGRVAFLKSKNHTSGVVFGSIILESVLMALSCLIIGFLTSFRILSQLELFICLGFILVLLIVLFANKTIMIWIYKIFKKQTIAIPQWDFSFSAKLLLLYLLTWLLAYISFVLLIISTLSIDLAKSLELGGGFLISWAVGFVTPMPGGIGSREAALIYILSKTDYAEISYFLSILSRMVMIISEIISFGILYLMNLIRNRNQVHRDHRN